MLGFLPLPLQTIAVVGIGRAEILALLWQSAVTFNPSLSIDPCVTAVTTIALGPRFETVFAAMPAP